jgi:predicted dehydrogenase
MARSQSDSAPPASGPIDVVVVGAGMFTRDVILPSLYHLQRAGEVGSISVAATSTARLAPLAGDEELTEAFPGQGFAAYPDLSSGERDPRAYLRALDALAPHQLVFVAVPDHLHHDIIVDALQRDQHVYSVKPLVQRFEQGHRIGELAAARGLFVGIDYHKRFDRRSLIARRQYGRGDFGEFAYGEARLFEPYFYRHSNFQNWFTCENSDPFTYVGCHYVDLVYFVTGLRPVAVSAAGATGAGLVLGAAHLAAPGLVRSVLPIRWPWDEAASIADLANQAAALLDLPPNLTAEQVRVDGGHVGPGYGQASPEGMAALALVARLEGILLDPVYTAKAMAALIADVRAGRYAPDQAVVFVHTGGTPALFAYRDDIARLVPRVTHAPPA